MTEEDMIYYGEAVKALGNGKLGGYLVRFTNPNEPDLDGDYFTAETDFGDANKSPVYYQHGQDPVLKKRKLGSAELKKDDFGVWAEAQLSMRDEYEKFIYEMAERGKLGWSSGTAGHLIEEQQYGKVYWIKSWPLGLDASLTPTPAEPRNSAMPLKSIKFEPLEGSTPTDASETQDGTAEPTATKIEGQRRTNNTEVKTMEITREELQELLTGAIKAAQPQPDPVPEPEPVDVEALIEAGVEKALKKLPAMKTDVKVIKDEADQEWDNPGEFFAAVKTAALHPAYEDKRLRSMAIKEVKASGLSENVPADGGYLLAPQVAGGILENMWGGGEILQRVASDPVGPNSNSILYNAVDETSRADGSRWGGVRGYWVAEAASITSSKPQFRQVELKLKKVAALCYATDEQLQDTVNLASWLTRTVPAELRFQVENAFINGNGVGKPYGILQNTDVLVTPLRIDANEVDATDIANMWSRRYAGVDDYVWLINSSVFPQLINLTIGNFPLLMSMNGGGRDNPAFTIYGKPVIETEYNPALGTSGDILLASLGQYQTINKGGVQAASSIHVLFDTDETAFRFTYRVDGKTLWSRSVETYSASATTKSPFVALTAASS